MKKVLTYLSVFALAFMVVAPGAYAMRGADTVVVNTNNASVVNDVESRSNTGHLYTSSGALGIAISGVRTGDARAANDVQTQANWNEITIRDFCGGCRGGSDDIRVRNHNNAFALNHVDASANTGGSMTTARAGVGATSLVSTGNATSGNGVVTVLNSNYIKISR